MGEKTILKLHANGDFETVDTQLIQSQITNNYSFTNNSITVPTIVEYSTTALEDMPAWVRDTGQPISFFPQGIVIKGDLIHAGQEPESDVLFMDDFNRANSNTLGDNWTITSRGNFTIENNMAKPTSGSNAHNVIFCSQSHGDNVSISADIRPNVSESIVFRAIDELNHLYIQFERQDLKLKQTVNGTVTTFKSVYLNPSNTIFYRVRVELRDTEIKVYVDDILYITHVTTAFLNNNLCGFQSWTNDANVGRFDNFKMEKLPSHVIFQDDFNRPDANTLGDKWEVVTGGYGIWNNQAHPINTTGTTNVAVVEVGVQNFVSVTAGVVNTHLSEGIWFRAIDERNQFIAQFEIDRVLLSIRVNGTKTLLKGVDYPTTIEREYKFHVELRDTEIKVFVNDELLITQIDSRFLDGDYTGLTSYSHNGNENIGYFDNFEVKKLPINE